MFLSVVGRPVSDIANPTYLAAYALTSVAAVLLGYVYSRRAEGTGRSGAAFDALQVGGANSGFVGYPVLLTVMPALAGVVLGMNVIVESVLTLPLVFFLAERGAADAATLRRQVAGTLLRMIQMPVFAALLTGMALSLAGVRVPEVGVTTLDLLGRAATGMALFTVGGMLVGLSVRGQLGRIAVVSAGKLAGMPALAVGSAWLLVAAGMPALDADLYDALVLSAAMPVFTSSVVFAARYGERQVPPAVLLVTTALSFATLTGLLAVLR